MAVQVPWDPFETALLIEAGLQVEHGEDRNTTVKNLSKGLRQRAIDAGLEIDEIYRNIRGVSSQLNRVQQLLRRDPDAEKQGSKLFVKMVNLYFEDRPAFEDILMKAKGLERAMKTNREQFSDWLSVHAQAARIASYDRAFDEIEEYARKKNLISGPLWDVTKWETSGKIVSTLCGDRYFRVTHKKDIGDCS